MTNEDLTSEADGMAALEGALGDIESPETPETQTETEAAVDQPETVEIETAEVESEEAVVETPADEEGDEETIVWGEGETAKSVKLSDLIEAYENPQVDFNEAPQVQERVQALQQVQQQFVQIAEQNVTERQQVSQQLEVIANSLVLPQRPDPRLRVDNPNAYNQAMFEYEQAEQRLTQVASAYQQNQQKIEAEQAQIEQITLAQEVAALDKAWPEYRQDKELASNVHKFAQETYGLTAQDLTDTQDHRAFLLMRDAYIGRQLQDKGEAAKATLKTTGAPQRIKARRSPGKSVKPLDILNQKIRSGKASESDAMSALESLM